ncbi:MAG: pseudaminic acid synthase [Pseudomonadota bacterium]|jgi:pseudaminic acid synthase
MSFKTIKIGNVSIGEDYPPFIIAEMSGNHNQSLERALKIVEAAAKSGAHAIKLQTYTADTMTIPGALRIEDPNSLWRGRELHELYKEAYTPWEWHKPIFEKAKELGLIAFSTPFDESAVDFLEELNVPAYKIASFENTDLPLLKKVAKTGKPIIISSGAATISDLDEALRTLRNYDAQVILLKCTSTYPSTPENTNLKTIPHMRELFQCHIGLSDHTMGIGVSVGAVAFGACVIEKHFTILRSDGGVDSAFSIEPDELRDLVIESERVFQALGKVQYGVLNAEKKSLDYKRSLYVVKDIKSGEAFTKDNVRIIRPGYGMAPKFYDIVLEKNAKCNIPAGTPLTWEIL